MARRAIKQGRTARLEFRLSDDERELVEIVAESLGFDKPGTWARSIVLGEARKLRNKLASEEK
jgi:hypothetical protein